MCFFDPFASFFSGVCCFIVFIPFISWDFVEALCLYVAFFNKRSRFISFYVRCSRFCFLSLCSNHWVALMFLFLSLDASWAWQFFFQDPATPVMEGIINLHHDLTFFIVFILFFVVLCWYRTLYFFQMNFFGTPDSQKVVHGTLIEIIWTVIPSLILVIIALPSFALVYSLDEVIDPSITIKCIGHQWYWSYEYSDFETKLGSLNFDSYLVPEDELELGELRLLEVDNRVVLPVNLHVRVLVTAADVLHSWAVPSLGIKIDACPGRLNQTTLFLLRSGVFYGQCSEICGVGHANMPIVIEGTDYEKYIAWISEKI